MTLVKSSPRKRGHFKEAYMPDVVLFCDDCLSPVEEMYLVKDKQYCEKCFYALEDEELEDSVN